MPHQVALLVYPGFELLDASGPAAVFTAANHALQQRRKRPFYAVEAVSAGGGPVASSSGITLVTRPVARMAPARIGTLLVAGAEEEHIRALIRHQRVLRWLARCADAAERFGSVCSGTFVLAALGLLNGKRAATHWSASAQLAQLYPEISVDANALYVVDGRVWTSAGVTTGIDMALAMVSRDIDSAAAAHAAHRLVLYARRPGYQSQFSPLLQAQSSADSPFEELTDWLQSNLHRSLDVPSLAARVGLSERSFYRKFVAATGQTPARFIETVRVDAARMLLSNGLALKTVAARVGLSPTNLTHAFQRRFGMSPGLFRQMHTR